MTVIAESSKLILHDDAHNQLFVQIGFLSLVGVFPHAGALVKHTTLHDVENKQSFVCAVFSLPDKRVSFNADAPVKQTSGEPLTEKTIQPEFIHARRMERSMTRKYVALFMTTGTKQRQPKWRK